MSNTAALTPLLRARQARLRNAESARRCELTASRWPVGSIHRADYAELAADYRATAAEWAAEVARLEAEQGITRRQCAEPSCPKRAGDHDPFCAEHD
jgi:hypothetical protein